MNYVPPTTVIGPGQQQYPVATYTPPPTNLDIMRLIQYTDQLDRVYPRCMVYGQAGVGKTRLLRTAPQPLVLSAEGGLLSLKREHIPFIEVKDMTTFQGIWQWLRNGGDNWHFLTIGIDSSSELAEVILSNEMKGARDPRKAYGEMAIQMMNGLRAYRDLPNRCVIFTAKQGRITDQQTGAIMWGPLMPGQQLDQQVPYMFDEVFHLGVYRNQQTGLDYAAIRTQPDYQYQAKDRSGSLDAWEQPDLTMIFNKIRG